jgi:hypothetical protein
MSLNQRFFWVSCAILVVTLAIGCKPGPKVSKISGNVTFKGKPVPAGYITFTPDVATGTLGQVVGFQIRDGKYDSQSNVPPGLAPGTYKIRIGGFDGVKIPLWGQGKQIFNPVEDNCVVPEGSSTKDFEIPASAGQNVKIEPTADT